MSAQSEIAITISIRLNFRERSPVLFIRRNP